MTTTEPAVEPVTRWEQIYMSHDYVPPVTETTATDADYLATRLRVALSDAARMAAESGAADITEGIRLRIEVEQLVDELTVFGRRGTELLGTLRRQCPGIDWERSLGHIGGTPSAWSLVDPVEPSARRLRLRPCDDPGRWSGVIEGVKVVLRGASSAASVERMRSEIGGDAADFLRKVGPDLPPLPWVRDSRELSAHMIDYPGIDEHTMAGLWAAALGITDLTQRDYGLSEYSGDTAVGPVRLTWVSDPVRWAAQVAEMREKRKMRELREMQG
ncbi:hypothetical protein ACWFPY_17905 [Nocardia fluminea]